MNTMKMIAIGMVAAAITGCAVMPQNFVAASKPVEQGRYTEVGPQVDGTDSQVLVLGFGAALPGSPQRRALEAALKKAAGADALVGMAVDVQDINLLWVHILTTRVTGTPVKTN